MRWLVANVLGALTGTLLGPFPISVLMAYIFNHHSRKFLHQFSIPDKARFFLVRSTGMMLTAIARADGIYSKSELAYIKNFLRHYFQMQESEYKWYLKDLKYFAFLPSLPIHKAIRMMNKYAHKHEKIFFIQCACEMVTLNRSLHPQQKRLIDLMGLSLGISPIEMNNIWHKYKTSVDKYFRILGVRPDAPVEIIRKRYYELAKFFHPDRFRHRSVSEQQFAEQKMKLINEAYNQILKFKQSVN